MKLQVLHHTHYAYDSVVGTSHHIAYLRPRSSQFQRLLSHSLDIKPAPAQLAHGDDVFGNSRCYFSLESPHTTLDVVACSVLETQGLVLPESRISWEQTRERLQYRAGRTFDRASEFAFASPLLPAGPDFRAYATPSFRPALSVLEVAHDLMQRIHRDFSYDRHSTQSDTPAQLALAQRKGVCQDFAHVMLACLRSRGLAARYVSGYVFNEPLAGPAALVGGDASHAWVAVYAPDLPEGRRWCEFDPTNQRCGWNAPGADYVTLAYGRDFSDVSPIRGVIYGSARQSLSVAVSVQALPEMHDTCHAPIQPHVSKEDS